MTTKPASSKKESLKLLHYIAVEMNNISSSRRLLQLILERCMGLTGATGGSVMLVDHKEDVLDITAFRGIDPEVAAKTRLKLGEGVTGWVVSTGTTKLINDVKDDPLYIAVRPDVQSELAVPIRTSRELIGVISMDSTKKNAFSIDDQELLSMVAEQAALILTRDRVNEELEQKVRSQDILISSFRIIQKEEDLSRVFSQIMEQLKQTSGIIRGMLAVFDKGNTGSLRIHSGYRISQESMQKGIYKIGEGIIGKAVLKGDTIAVRDVNKEPDFLNRMKINRTGSGPVSFFAAPIKIGNEVIGVLAVENKLGEGAGFEDMTKTLTLLTSLIAERVRHSQMEEERTSELMRENQALKRELKQEYNPNAIIGKNEAIRVIISQVEQVSGTFAPVLITGETGTGKELIAKAIHFNSDRRDQPFISVNCSAVPENLLEAELFGYVKGAFTGASQSRKGKFEQAHQGTLFLDEIGDMALHLQAKILRALQEKEIEPLGSEHTRRVDIRILAATNRDLAEMMEKKEFRSDLYFRLNVITMHLPALRDRKDDLVLLINFFLQKLNTVYKKKILGLEENVLKIMQDYSWPGNIRELENCLERAVIMCKGNLIDLSLLPENLKPQSASPTGFQAALHNYITQESARKEGELYKSVIGKAEKILISEVLVNANYNKSRASQILGINRNTLKTKMKEYGIE